jgi:hypothetical protein
MDTAAEIMLKDTPYTHFPALVLAFFGTMRDGYHSSGGPILEMGLGYGSTPGLSRLAANHGRLLVSVESNPEWAANFAALNSGTHRIVHVPSWESFDYRPPAPWERWALVLVDHAPGEYRPITIEALRNLAEFIVVHDTETPDYGWNPVVSSFKYRLDYTLLRPWTTILSEVRDPMGLLR